LHLFFFIIALFLVNSARSDLIPAFPRISPQKVLLSKEIKSHGRVGFLGFALSGFLCWGGSSGGNWGGFNDESRWIGQESFGLFGGWEGDVGGGGNGDKFLQTVGDGVRSRSQSWVTDVQRTGGDGVDSGHELGSDIVFADVEDGWFENGAFVEALDDFETVGKWRNFQHVQQSGFGSTDFVAWLQNVDVGDDFNGSSSDFGLDVQSLKETGFFWTLAGVLGWDDNVQWRDGTLSSWGGNFVLQEFVSDGGEIFVGEHESDVVDQEWENFLVVWEFFEHASDALFHHGVLAHNDGGLSSESRSDLSELEGSDVVGVNQNKFGVVSDGIFQLVEVVGFPGLSGGEVLVDHFG